MTTPTLTGHGSSTGEGQGMTPVEQRIAIAEACGWKWCRIGTEARPHRMLCMWNPVYTAADGTEPICGHQYMWVNGMVPDYLNDLNEMYQAEKMLTNDQLHTYCNVLRRIVEEQELQGRGRSYIFTATASQRAEAFLKTLGLWKPSPAAFPGNARQD